MALVSDIEDIRAVLLNHVLNQLVSKSMVVEKRNEMEHRLKAD